MELQVKPASISSAAVIKPANRPASGNLAVVTVNTVALGTDTGSALTVAAASYPDLQR